MRNQNLFNAIERITGYLPLESDMDEIKDALRKDDKEQNNGVLNNENKWNLLNARATLFPGKSIEEVYKILDL